LEERFCKVCKKKLTRREDESKSHAEARKFCDMKCYNISKKGSGNPFYGKHFSPEAKRKLSEARKGKPSKIKGIPKSYEAIKKMRLAHRDKQMGSNNPNWRGGTSKLRWLIQSNYRYIQWKLAVFNRDRFNCQVKGCNSTELHPHHIKPIGQSIKDYNIKTIEEAIKCQEIWDVNNGITLCKQHHRDTDSYGRPFRKRGESLLEYVS
jgi:HNH endonuclease/NUMOD3 motif-containing protein